MSTEKIPQNVGVINPYALAEVVLKKKVNWNRVGDTSKFLENTLKTPYAELFDMKYDSPLYFGLKHNPATKLVERIKTVPKTGSAAEALVNVGTPANAVWVDVGHFFEEFTELTDPIQGAVGNCYLIAALAAVAWTRPYVIAQRTRQTQAGVFTDMVECYDAGGAKKQIEASEKLPVIPPANNLFYARSSDPGEIWPGVYEKIFAKWHNNDPGDTPDISLTAGGDPVGALHWLMDSTSYYYGTADMDATAIWNTIKSNCNMSLISRPGPRPGMVLILGSSGMPFNPMVAWTYPSGSDSPDNVIYASARIAANHAYTVCGLMTTGSLWNLGTSYVVLRNPWGNYESTLSPNSTWAVLENGVWRSFSFPTNDGIFGLPVAEFKKYFAGFGTVK
jgi:hypothetical protein